MRGAQDDSRSVPPPQLYGPPALSPDGAFVYIVLTDGLHAYNASNGAHVWMSAKPGCSETTPVVVDGVVYVAGGEDGGVLSFNAVTGAAGWISAAGTSSPWASPVVANGTVFSSGFAGAQYNTGVVYALNAANGAVRWSTNLTTIEPYTYAPFGKVVANGVVFVTGATPTFFALDVDSGGVVWKADICQGHLWGTPAISVDGATVYTGCDDGTLYALSASGGATVWSYKLPGASGAARSPVLMHSKVFYGTTPLRGGENPKAEKLVVLRV